MDYGIYETDINHHLVAIRCSVHRLNRPENRKDALHRTVGTYMVTRTQGQPRG